MWQVLRHYSYACGLALIFKNLRQGEMQINFKCIITAASSDSLDTFPFVCGWGKVVYANVKDCCWRASSYRHNVKNNSEKKSSLKQISIQSWSSSPWGDYIGQNIRLKSQWQQWWAIHSYWSYPNIQLCLSSLSNSTDSQRFEDLIYAKQNSLIFPLSAVWYDMIHLWIADIENPPEA